MRSSDFLLKSVTDSMRKVQQEEMKRKTGINSLNSHGMGD